MKNIIKKCVCLISACAVALSLTACGSGSGTNGKTPAPADITTKVMQQVKFAETEEITTDRLSRFYTVDASSVSKMSLYVSTSLASADEVAVFVGKSAADTAKIKTAVDARITKRESDLTATTPQNTQRCKIVLWKCAAIMCFSPSV